MIASATSKLDSRAMSPARIAMGLDTSTFVYPWRKRRSVVRARRSAFAFPAKSSTSVREENATSRASRSRWKNATAGAWPRRWSTNTFVSTRRMRSPQLTPEALGPAPPHPPLVADAALRQVLPQAGGCRDLKVPGHLADAHGDG